MCWHGRTPALDHLVHRCVVRALRDHFVPPNSEKWSPATGKLARLNWPELLPHRECPDDLLRLHPELVALQDVLRIQKTQQDQTAAVNEG